MKTASSLLFSAGLALALVSSTRAENEPGYIDIGKLMPSAKGEYVEVNLSPAMLKFAAKIAAKQEPEAAELIGNLKRVRVNVVSMDDSNRQATIDQIDGIRRKLESDGWHQMVTVREKHGGDNVGVHVKQKGDDVIEGLVVTVIDGKGEAVIVNIVGIIDAERIAKIADSLNIEPLKKVRLKVHKNRDHDEDDEA